MFGSTFRVLSRTSVSYYRFLALSLVICPFPAILLAPSIFVFTYGVFGYVVSYSKKSITSALHFCYIFREHLTFFSLIVFAIFLRELSIYRAPDKLRICIFYAINACIIRSECTHYAYILLCKQTFQIRSVLVRC